MKGTERRSTVAVAVAVCVGVGACVLAPVALMLASAVFWYVFAAGLTR